MNRELLPSKLKASGIHLGLSLLIFFILLGISMVYWYPGNLFTADGGWQGLRIVVLVDVVLGPLLTFMVFNPTKKVKESVIDLSVIALIQLAALGYGVHTTYTQHPVAMVLLDGNLVPVVRDDYKDQIKSLDDLAPYTINNRPLLASAEIAIDSDVIKQVFETEKEQGIPVNAQLQIYQDKASIPEALKQVQFKARENPEWQKRFQDWLKQHQLDADKVLVVPMASRYKTSYQVFSPEGQWLGGFVW